MVRLTKHEHACLVVTTAESSIVVDPGNHTLPLLDVDGVVAIVITHEHPDHWTSEQLQRILDRNNNVRIFGPPGVAAAAPAFAVEKVKDGDSHEVGPFSLRFFGSTHAIIHESIPAVENTGVLINELLYYAGDSYTVPAVPVDTLAVPIGAPWLKISESMDYVTAVKPRRSFPTHDMGLSVIGRGMANERIEQVTVASGGQFFPLEAGQSLDI